MAFLDQLVEVVSFTTALIIFLLNAYEDLDGQRFNIDDGGDDSDDDMKDVFTKQEGVLDMATITASTLHIYRLCHMFCFLNDDLGYWIKPRSTTWFTRFLIEQCKDDRWVESFRMSKAAVLNLTELLRPCIVNRDISYRLAIPPVVQVAVMLFKLA
jgi:hypothetical protein